MDLKQQIDNLNQQYLRGDKVIWAVVGLLALLSVMVVFSSSDALVYKFQGGNFMYYFLRHSGFLLSGFAIMIVVHRMKYTYFSRLSQILLYVSIPLLLLTLIRGENIHSASRWLTIPVINQSFQTSDFAKLALIMYLARTVAVKQDELGSFRSTLIHLFLPTLIVCGLILPANLSTATVLFIASCFLMFIGRVPIKWMATMILSGVVGLVLLIGTCSVGDAVIGDTVVCERCETWKNRIFNFQDHSSRAAQEGNYQVQQSKIAIATGGVLGKGPGNSVQRNVLPHPYSDFIFAIVIEEYGMIGGLVVVMLYLILLFRAIKVAHNCPRTFGALLALGICFSLVLQAFVNMAVAVNLVPVTGQPLPMLSMGGTSIWFTSLAIGIVLSVSKSERSTIKTKDGYVTH